MTPVREELLSLIRATIGRADVHADARWDEYEDLESFALVELLVGVQERFGIQFHPNDLRGVAKVSDLSELVERKLAEKQHS